MSRVTVTSCGDTGCLHTQRCGFLAPFFGKQPVALSACHKVYYKGHTDKFWWYCSSVLYSMQCNCIRRDPVSLLHFWEAAWLYLSPMPRIHLSLHLLHLLYSTEHKWLYLSPMPRTQLSLYWVHLLHVLSDTVHKWLYLSPISRSISIGSFPMHCLVSCRPTHCKSAAQFIALYEVTGAHKSK